MNRAVFDTSVLISAFLTPGGVSSELLDLAGTAFELATSKPILAEVARVVAGHERLKRRYGYDDTAVELYLTNLRRVAAMIGELPDLTGVVRDPEDDVIVATAVAAEARFLVSRDRDLFLVSRDRDLLDLGHYGTVTILSPEMFREHLRGG